MVDQERMTILKLLQDGKISAQEAADLLRALEPPAPEPTPRVFSFHTGEPRGRHDDLGHWAETAGRRAEAAGRRAEAIAERVPEMVERLVGRLEFGGLGWFGSGFRFDETVEGELDPDLETAELAVATTNGRVTIRTTDEARKVRVVLHKTVRGASEGDARSRGESIGRARVEGGRVVVEGRTSGSGWLGGGCGVAAELFLPRGLQWSGAVETSNGRVDIEGLTFRGLQVTTSNGRIQLTDCRGRDLAGRTSNGRIEARRLQGQARLHTSNGSIEAHVDPAEGDNVLDLETSNGPIRIEGPSSAVGWSVDLATSGGRLRCGLPGVQVDGGGSQGWGRGRAHGQTPEYEAQSRRIRCEARTSNGGISVDSY